MHSTHYLTWKYYSPPHPTLTTIHFLIFFFCFISSDFFLLFHSRPIFQHKILILRTLDACTAIKKSVIGQFIFFLTLLISRRLLRLYTISLIFFFFLQKKAGKNVSYVKGTSKDTYYNFLLRRELYKMVSFTSRRHETHWNSITTKSNFPSIISILHDLHTRICMLHA